MTIDERLDRIEALLDKVFRELKKPRRGPGRGRKVTLGLQPYKLTLTREEKELLGLDDTNNDLSGVDLPKLEEIDFPELEELDFPPLEDIGRFLKP